MCLFLAEQILSMGSPRLPHPHSCSTKTEAPQFPGRKVSYYFWIFDKFRSSLITDDELLSCSDNENNMSFYALIS